MNWFDTSIIRFLNGFVDRSWLFDRTVEMACYSSLLKGGAVVAVMWALWFSSRDEEVLARSRSAVLATLAGTLVAITVTRVLALVLPFRLRPKFNPDLLFVIPEGIQSGLIEARSSLPSDHAGMFMALAVGIFMVSRRLGLAAIAYVLLVVLFPRVYLGLHYPTDIIAGGLLGAAIVIQANNSKTMGAIATRLLEWSGKSPALFYGVFFLGTFEMAEQFINIQRIGKLAITVAQALAQRYS